MLNIYVARENINKNKIIFDQIKNTAAHKVLLVPDQFTLQSEKNAFKFLNKSAIIDLEILSPSRLGHKILKEVGMPAGTVLDNYGRHMMLFRIMQRNSNNFLQFGNMLNKPGFIELVNEQIGELQQYYIDSAKLCETFKSLDENTLLYKKLNDLCLIYEEYERQIAEKYIDTTDINEIFINAVKDSNFVTHCNFWVSGFDYLAPKNMGFLMEIAEIAPAVNFFLTCDMSPDIGDRGLFEGGRRLILRLQEACRQRGIPCFLEEIEEKEEWISECADFSKHIEKQLYAFPFKAFENNAEGLHLHYSKNAYTEAETAAAFIRKLLREKGLKLSDIAVICNDEYGGSIVKRSFEQYGISAFLDQNRDVLSNKAVSLNLALLHIMGSNMSTSGILSFLKTGFSDLSREEISILENYVNKFKIKGNMWLKDFYKFDSRSPFATSLDEINKIREKAISPLIKFKNSMSTAESAQHKIQSLYEFISKDLKIVEKLKEKIREYEESGFHEKALENAQIWNKIVKLYEQFALILKDEKISHKNMEEILKSGFSTIKLGMIPSTSDTVLIGTMQRSRIGPVPVLIILDANEGVLPLTLNQETLISSDEKTFALEKTGTELGNSSQMLMLEEKTSIYRMLSSPTRELFVSYQLQSLSAEPKKPSQIFLRLSELFPKNRVKADIYSYEKNLALLVSPKHILHHLADKLRLGKSLNSSELFALKWIYENENSLFRMLVSGLNFNVKADNLAKLTTKELFLKSDNSMRLSPSRLENFARCPFAYFMNYGIKPDKNELFELSSREFGDIYHNCAQKVSEKLSSDGFRLTDPSSKWQTVTEEEIEALVSEIVDEETSAYKDGFIFDVEEGNYKIERIKKVCIKVISAIIFQVRAGQIEKLMSEIAFGNNPYAKLPAIEPDCGFPITIEGKIDRLDILKGNYCKVIDYKSGSTTFDKDSALAGFQLQLAIYMSAYISGHPESKAGGMFYFRFSSENINLALNNATDSLDSSSLREFKLDGVFLDSDEVIDALDSNFSGHSKIAGIQRTKDGIKHNPKTMLSETEFADFLNSVSSTISKLCQKLSDGNIDIYPAKINDKAVCEFCDYSSICKFEKSLPNCTYRKSW